MPNEKTYQTEPRNYVWAMVDEGLVSADDMLTAAIKAMSHDDVRAMLDANELSPRFMENDDDEQD